MYIKIPFKEMQSMPVWFKFYLTFLKRNITKQSIGTVFMIEAPPWAGRSRCSLGCNVDVSLL
jgi:hypothetical protein